MDHKMETARLLAGFPMGNKPMTNTLITLAASALLLLLVVVTHCVFWYQVYKRTGGLESFRDYCKYL